MFSIEIAKVGSKEQKRHKHLYTSTTHRDSVISF